MEEFIKIITHASRFKSSTKELTIEELQDVRGKLEQIIEARIAAEIEEKQRNSEKIEKIEKYREMIAADGIDLSEIVGDYADMPVKRAPRLAKFETWNKEGARITWAGQGRMPTIFKAKIEAGESIENFLIK